VYNAASCLLYLKEYRSHQHTFPASYRSAGEIKDTTSWSYMQKQQTTPT